MKMCIHHINQGFVWGVGKSSKIPEPSLDSNSSLSEYSLGGYLAGLIEGDGSSS